MTATPLGRLFPDTVGNDWFNLPPRSKQTGEQQKLFYAASLYGETIAHSGRVGGVVQYRIRLPFVHAVRGKIDWAGGVTAVTKADLFPLLVAWRLSGYRLPHPLEFFAP